MYLKLFFVIMLGRRRIHIYEISSIRYTFMSLCYADSACYCWKDIIRRLDITNHSIFIFMCVVVIRLIFVFKLEKK